MTAAMTADEAQGVVPLPWFFGLVAAGLLLILLRVSWERLRDARQGWAARLAVRADDRLGVYGTGDEPELSVTEPLHPSCRCPLEPVYDQQLDTPDWRDWEAEVSR